MPFLKFSRDKRGYENLYLVENTDRRGRSRPQILYWFHTPPNAKVGREAFDPTVRRALEAQYPHLRFDWPRLLDIRIPPVEAEEWRERRRAARAAKLAAGAEEAADEEAAAAKDGEDLPAAQAGTTSDGQSASETPVEPESSPVMPVTPVTLVTPGAPAAAGQFVVPESPAAQSSGQPQGRRRRRRRGRRHDRGVEGSGVPNQEPANPAPNPVPGTENPEPEEGL